MANKRALEPEFEALLRKEHDRASKAKRVLEPASQALQRKEQNKASMANKRALEPESEALLHVNVTVSILYSGSL